MHWRQLVKAMPLYREATNNNDPTYLKTINDPTPEQIVRFLKHTRMRRGFDTGEISKCITESKNDLDKFRERKFESIDNLIPLKDNIQDIFQKFLESTGSAVASSKVLHILAPKFFVMWDTAIRAGYGLGVTYDKAEVKNIYYLFLERVQCELRKAIQSYADDYSINSVEASSALIKVLSADGRKTLAKIVDEYNFVKFTRGMKNGAELWTE